MIPVEFEQGPAMKALPNERWRGFVMALLAQGVNANQSEAYKACFGEVTDGTAKVNGHRLAHDPRIQAAVLEESKKRFNFATIQASGFLVQVMQDDAFPIKERMKAATEILDRGGIPRSTEHNVNVHAQEKSRVEKLKDMVELAHMMNVDPKELLGNMTDAIPGDFEVVEKVINPEEVQDGTGQEAAAGEKTGGES